MFRTSNVNLVPSALARGWHWGRGVDILHHFHIAPRYTSWKEKEGLKLMFFRFSHLVRIPPLHIIYKHIAAVKATIDNQESTRKTVVKVGGFLFRRRTPGCLPKLQSLPRVPKIAKVKECHIVKLNSSKAELKYVD